MQTRKWTGGEMILGFFATYMVGLLFAIVMVKLTA